MLALVLVLPFTGASRTKRSTSALKFVRRPGGACHPDRLTHDCIMSRVGSVAGGGHPAQLRAHDAEDRRVCAQQLPMYAAAVPEAHACVGHMGVRVGRGRAEALQLHLRARLRLGALTVQ